MSKSRHVLFVLTLFGLLAWVGAAGAATEDKTLSPYFFVESGDPAVDRLPLEGTSVRATVSGVIADLEVTQTYTNEGKRPINAKYVFPASTRAAVHGMKMIVGDQVIEAKIEERKEAAKQFEEAKEAGKNAALLEQERPNVFSMGIANVMPGDRIQVTLSYTEHLVPVEGTYELVYPTVVGPRYGGERNAAQGGDGWVASAYTKEGDAPTYDLDMSVTLSSAIPIRRVASPTHAILEQRDNPNLVRVELDESEKKGGNRDVILRYGLAGEAIQSGLMLYENASEKFFMLVVEPPARVSPDEVPPREYVFVVDVSGSMHGFPLDTAKEALRKLVGGLRPVDRFNVLLFSGGSHLMSRKSVAATPENVSRALSVIDDQDGGGGTGLVRALRRAMSLSPEPGLSRSFVVVTDGYVVADKPAFDYVRANLGEANVFSFGIGSGVNRYLVDGLARAGLGEPFVITDPREAAPVAERFQRYVSTPVLTDIAVRYDGFEVYDVEPKAIPDVLAERPVVIFGKWRGNAEGSIELAGVGGRGRYTQRFEVARVAPRAENRALPYLWARTRIANLSDYGFDDAPTAVQAEVTRLGLRYNLLTQYTSFIAVAHALRNADGSAIDVDQPLALPAGVSSRAVGGAMMGAIEPPLWLLMVLTLSLGLLLRFRAVRPGSFA